MTVKVFPTLIARWKKRWQQQDLTWRLRELGYQVIGYLVLSIVLTGAFGVLAYYTLPPWLADQGTKFLAVLYMLMLLITTAHAFDRNHTNYLMEKMEYIDAVVHKLDEIQHSLEELGPP